MGHSPRTRVADVIVETLASLGATDVFSVTGGAAMHLNDAFAIDARLSTHFMHNEQACAIAAEGYARIDWRPAVVCVTAGPGAINALNGVFGAYTDSVPMFVLSGQSRSDMLLTSPNAPRALRQLGDQEASVIPMVHKICKAVHQMSADDDVVAVVSELFLTSIEGRPGPVWLEVPVDIQGLARDLPTETGRTAKQASSQDALSPAETSAAEVARRIAQASRPVVLAGTGVRVAGVMNELRLLAERGQIPVVTAWTHDVFPNDHELFAGRPGTIGTRPGNMVVQAADLVVVLGSRLNVRQVSYNWDAFAPLAEIVHVDIDEPELHKPYLEGRSGMKIVSDLRDFLPALAQLASPPLRPRDGWLAWVRNVRREWEPREANYPIRTSGINPYHFVMELSTHLAPHDVVVSGDATACIVPFQVLPVVGEQRIFSNSGCASMGYDLPAALGAAVAAPGRRVLCFAGDGSLMMNLQELQTLKSWNPDLILFVLDNNGYLSIKQTQSNFFGRSTGSSPQSGVSFPDFCAVARGFGLEAVTLSVSEDWRGHLQQVLGSKGPLVCVVKLDQEQEFEPRLRSRMTDAGIVTPPLDDMYPHLEPEVLEAIRQRALLEL